MDFIGKILDNKYKIEEKIGEGSFGTIYKGKNINTDASIAIKIDLDKDSLILKNEARIYNMMVDTPGYPSMKIYGKQEDFSYLILDLLGESLESLRIKKNEPLSIKFVTKIGIQMLKRIEDFHNKGLIHRDIKPDNFLFGKGMNGSILYLIDYGLSRCYIQKGKHIELNTGRSIVGTTRYISVNIHKGLTPSRRDDMESIGYTLLYLLSKQLPWQGLPIDNFEEKTKLVCKIKDDESLWELFQDIPGEFITFIIYCRKLKYDEMPNYKYLCGLLSNLYKLLDTNS
tara:strand:+ start:2124 stop:2978 length:855 start_codon:yes stop_codon:yes gene_type:complete